jgi:PPOX class probable F420-dependent enzyme
MTGEERDAFLSAPRYAILTTLRGDGSPVSVPVWFDWDGRAVSMFTHIVTAKLRRIQGNSLASVLVTNAVDELESWVAFDGEVTVHDGGGLDLAERLAPKYWDVNDPARAAALQSWRQMASGWRLLELVPKRIRTYVD